MGDINGTSWLVVAFYLPIVEVAVGLTIWQLLTRRGESMFETKGEGNRHQFEFSR
jgi:hypothetical protein